MSIFVKKKRIVAKRKNPLEVKRLSGFDKSLNYYLKKMDRLPTLRAITYFYREVERVRISAGNLGLECDANVIKLAANWMIKTSVVDLRRAYSPALNPD